MTTVNLLPLKSISLRQADRLCAHLEDAIAGGEKLGSRAYHIQANGMAIMQLSSDLKVCLEQLNENLKILGLEDTSFRSCIEEIINVATKLSIFAKSYAPNSNE